ncbi:MAG: EMC3/TMCO1 family protein [Candidatus Marsarchaeota archaeon]|nr:EMC3/TMCO1 family protein [Candidatus Marsarchaeota archaeon]
MTVAATTPIPLTIEVAIILIAALYTSTTVLLQRKMSNPKRMRAARAEMKRIQDEMKVLLKNKASREEIAAKQKEIMPLVSATTKGQLKSMFIILPVFLILYDVILPAAFGSVTGTVNFIFQLNYQGLFFACVFILGMVATVITLAYDRKKTKEEKAAAQSGAQANQ